MTRRRRRSERGIALIAVAVFLSALLAFTAIAVDLGRLTHTATEVQTVADASARAGAVSLHDAGGAAGASDPSAHVVAHHNIMNGELAPDTDVQTGDHQIHVEEGNYDFETGAFTPAVGNAKRLAVQVTANTTVDNLFAGIFDFISPSGRLTATQDGGNARSQVTKVAIAAFAGPKGGCEPPEGCGATDYACFCQHNVAPCLPIATWSCLFPDPCPDTGCVLPTLQMNNATTDTAAFTGFQAGHSTSVLRGYIPPPCNRRGASPPDQTAFDDDIDLTNGVSASLFTDMQCVLNNHLGCKDTNGDGIFDGAGGDMFTIPVIELSTCGTNPQGMHEIIGFATIRIASVAAPPTKHIVLQSIKHADTNSVLGGDDFGSGRVLLVR